MGTGKYARVERERRFLVRALPDGTLVRKLGHKVRTAAGPGEVAHTSLYLDETEWQPLTALPARVLRKVRHRIHRDGWQLAVDELEDGTLLAEIDDGESPSSQVPAWLDVIREVTDEEAWTGGGLARLSA